MKKYDEIIAKFMGYKIGNLSGWVSGTNLYAYKKDGVNIVEAISVTKLKYATSYDALMPVLLLILCIDQETLGDNETRLTLYGKQQRIKALSILTPIDTLYNTIGEFIEWYNVQTTKQLN